MGVEVRLVAGPQAMRTAEEIIEEIRRLPVDERARLLRLLRASLNPGDPALLWDDFDDPEIDRLYGEDKP